MQKIALVLFLFPLTLFAADLHFPQNVKLTGELEKRIRLTEKRFLYEPFDLDLIVQDVARTPELLRRFEEYEGDVSGRILGSWSYLSRLVDQHPPKLDDIFTRILPYQNAAGYFGQDQKGVDWDYWGRQTFGHGRLLGGLVQYYLLTKDERALNAAAKLGDYFVQNIPNWTTAFTDNPWTNNDTWINWDNQQLNRQHFVKTHMTSILESLMMLYEIYPQQKYLDAGKWITTLIPEFGHYHSHSYMNTMVGLAMLYEKTGDKTIFRRLYNMYWQDVREHSYTVDGGMREWFPDDIRTEGCSVTDWIRLNLNMWKITREAVYLHEAEKSWYNALYFHQTANGAFGHAVCSPTGYEATYSEAWWCCTMHGLWAFADLVNFSAASEADTLWFNFYAPMSFDLNDMNFTITTEYPQDAIIQIQNNRADTHTRTTCVRVPDWVENFSITLNGENIAGRFSSGVFSFDHLWKKGDILRLNFPLALVLVNERGNNLLKRQALGDYIYQASFFYGPLLLGISAGQNNLPDKILFNTSKDYRTESNDPNVFALNKAHFMIPAVADNFQSMALLRPISEITGCQEWTDGWRNFIRNGEKPIARQVVQIKHQVRIKQ